jgi:hypothetical protein
MIIQSIGIWIILYSQAFPGWITGMSLLGVGTAMVYPSLLAAISDMHIQDGEQHRWEYIDFGET